MTNTKNPDVYVGRDAVDPQGNKIGTVGQVYLNDQTGEPDWITVNTGLFGMKENFAPLAGSTFSGDELVLPFDKTVVKDAPDVPDSSHLDAGEQQSLNSYYQRYLDTVDRAEYEQTTAQTSTADAPGGTRDTTPPARTPITR